MDLDRRSFVRIAAATMAAETMLSVSAADALSFNEQLNRSAGRVIPTDSSDPGLQALKLELAEVNGSYAPKLTNTGTHAVCVKEVVLFELKHSLPPESALYGDSFQMLSQTGGTLGHPVDLGYNEVEHYRVPGPSDATVLTGVMTISTPAGMEILMGYTSCQRFSGRFYLRSGVIQAVVDTEGLVLGPGETWQLEHLIYISGRDRNALLKQLAERIEEHHPPLPWRRPPTGWCSYYAYGNDFTAKEVLEDTEFITQHIPQLTYVQVDDGYQPWMGDWLDTVPAFGEDIGMLLKQIRDRGQEPALWIGPFIADPQSNLFQQHPQWFIHDSGGKPLQAINVTFSGWGRKDWYALDGTNPEVQQHLENVFRYMRQEWDCKYFKLDANFWGAMHGGKLYDPRATRVEAYRSGMKAIRRGAGEDSFLLGCNHPIWPSLGLIHGSRSSDDIARNWQTVEKVATQTLERNWQNGTLWWNDPDAVCLTGKLSPDEFAFHATAAYASGGMILSGDILGELSLERLSMLRKLLPPHGVAAEFEDTSITIGRIHLADCTMVCVFNRGEEEKSFKVNLSKPSHIFDFWSEEELGKQLGSYQVRVKGHSARLLRCL